MAPVSDEMTPTRMVVAVTPGAVEGGAGAVELLELELLVEEVEVLEQAARTVASSNEPATATAGRANRSEKIRPILRTTWSVLMEPLLMSKSLSCS
jgi:hypothetical protein